MSTRTQADEAEAVRFDRDSAGIVTLVLDDPTQGANTMNAAYVASMRRAVDRLEAERDEVRGVVVTSAKQTFFAGGDLATMMLATPDDAAEVFATIEEVKRQLRALETLGRPVVAAMGGSALGGGYEIALACHHRIAVADGRSEFGLPEVSLGLLPGGGGVTRTVRMFGLQEALTNVLLRGPRMRPDRALAAGLVDELVDSVDDLVPAGRAWVLAHADADDGDDSASTQPWDRPGYRIPGGAPSSPKLAQLLPAFASHLRQQTKGAPYTAPRAIMAAAVEGAQVDVDTALRIESRYLTSLLIRQQFKDMAKALFFDVRHINAGGSRPDGPAPWRASKVAVVGAGMMGAGIACSTARAGMPVMLADVDAAAAERGTARCLDLLDKAVGRGRMSPAERDDVLASIHPTSHSSDLEGCDLLIEAVFEDLDLKHRVYRDLEPILAADALLASNTSTLPITALAKGVQRRDDFIGLHFFSPVDKMPLVEIIVGEQTSDAALARAYDFVLAIRKTPIVVNDSRGFFTSRVFGTLLMEAVGMVREGCNPVSIERATTRAGFPAPPLAMLDEVSLTLVQHIDTAAAQEPGHERPPGMDIVDRMVGDFDRRGKAAGAGFYAYPEDGQKWLWPGLWDELGCARDGDSPVPFTDMQERLTFVMTLETVRCLDEGVLRSVPDANVGSILGIGFPPLRGGALQHVNGYAGGPAGFVARAGELAAAYGDRFAPPASLVTLAEAHQTYR